MSVTSVNRREFLKVGAAGFATAMVGGCGPKDQLQIRFRGLQVLETFDKRAVLHAVDSTILSIANHRPVLKIRKSALHLGTTNVTPSSKEEENTTKETWVWDLKGKQVRFHEQEPTSNSLTYDVSHPSLPSPGESGTWKSTLLLPDLKKLSGATKMTRHDASAVQIELKDGHIEADKPRSTNGKLIVWTFKHPTTSQTVLEQGLSDTLLYLCPLNGELPIIRIGSDSIRLASGKSEFVSIENMMAPPPSPAPGTPFTLSHFEVLYGLVDKTFEPTSTAVPPNPSTCPKCDVDPFYCPPAVA
jgi:hypothetical protein